MFVFSIQVILTTVLCSQSGAPVGQKGWFSGGSSSQILAMNNMNTFYTFDFNHFTSYSHYKADDLSFIDRNSISKSKVLHKNTV